MSVQITQSDKDGEAAVDMSFYVRCRSLTQAKAMVDEIRNAIMSYEIELPTIKSK